MDYDTGLAFIDVFSGVLILCLYWVVSGDSWVALYSQCSDSFPPHVKCAVEIMEGHFLNITDGVITLVISMQVTITAHLDSHIIIFSKEWLLDNFCN